MIKIGNKTVIKSEFCIEEAPKPCGIIIFGASGDLTHRKLIPSLFSLYIQKLLPENFFILGFARTEMNDKKFRYQIKSYLKKTKAKTLQIDSFLKKCFYTSGIYTEKQSYKHLCNILKRKDKDLKTLGNFIFYMATPPDLVKSIISNIAKFGLSAQTNKEFRRFVIEKPFGTDLESALSIDRNFKKYIKEDQIYRIDHYLGKETVQNILMFRFANTIFQPIWNNKYISNIQITVAEDIGIEHRSGYFDKAGIIRDVFQNHMLQLMALTAMEEPKSFEASDIKNAKAELLKAIKPLSKSDLKCSIVKGQYTAGRINNKHIKAYLDEANIPEQSTTETFFAAKLLVENKRWKGVPFYLKTGKRLSKKETKIIINFKPAVCSMFNNTSPIQMTPNSIIINIQPNEGIGISIQAKHPGPKLCINSLMLDFCYSEVFEKSPSDAYERLLLDCMNGDQTLFIRRDAIRLQWSLIMPILKASKNLIPIHSYKAGTWGPKSAENLLASDGFHWSNTYIGKCKNESSKIL